MDTTTTTKRLERPKQGRVLAGVAEGISRHLEVDPALVRIGLAATSIVGGVGIVLYALAWLVIPEEDAEQSPLARDAATWAVWALVALAILTLVNIALYGAWLVWA